MDTQDMPALDNALRPRDPGPQQTTNDVSLQPHMHPDHAAPEPDDAGAPRRLLHPVESPPPWPYAKTVEDKIIAVEDFALRLSSVVEEEYGDWMRRANTYWWHLAEALENESPEIKRLMRELHDLIQFNPDFRIIETRRMAVELSLRIRERLGAKHPLTLEDFGLSLSRETSEPPVPSYSDRFKNTEEPHVEGVTMSHETLTINAGADGQAGVFHG